MTQQNDLTTVLMYVASSGKRVVQGAVIALSLIIMFFLSAGEPEPAWGKLWMIRPLLVVSLAGALGGLFYHLMGALRSRGGWVKAVAVIMGLAGYCIILWLGIVFGLKGTMWH